MNRNSYCLQRVVLISLYIISSRWHQPHDRWWHGLSVYSLSHHIIKSSANRHIYWVYMFLYEIGTILLNLFSCHLMKSCCASIVAQELSVLVHDRAGPVAAQTRVTGILGLTQWMSTGTVAIVTQWLLGDGGNDFDSLISHVVIQLQRHSFKIPLEWMPLNTRGHKSTLFQGSTGRHQATRNYSSQC